MSFTVSLFVRGSRVTWRDTGRRVVALAPETTDVRVLGGGAAHVWRALDRPVSVADLVDRLHRQVGFVVRAEDIANCLGDLVAMGLVQESA